MTVTEAVTLIVAICGVLHGPLVPYLLGLRKNRKAKQ